MAEFHDAPATPNLLPRASIKLPVSMSERPYAIGLEAYKDHREIVRLVQCQQCDRILENPMTLPCGNSLCRRCLPSTHVRENISYPATASRLHGFICPFPDCGKEHAEGDCNLDVTLSKIMEVVEEELRVHTSVGVDTGMESEDSWQAAGIPSLSSRPPGTQVLRGGRLVTTYMMAKRGELPYGSDVAFDSRSDYLDDHRSLDLALIEHLKESTRAELDCQVCYALMLDPLTTNCGHTFCRKCLHRVIDHSNLCPICRQALALPPIMTPTEAPTNKRLMALLLGLCPDLLAARAEAAANEGVSTLGGLDTPLFVCTLSFPAMPTFLHIFEPRYRLMIRRAIESGHRKFGMLLSNPRHAVQGDLGRVPFYQYGTLLHIVNTELLSDGRSLIQTVGINRFKVQEHGLLDGYFVGRIERIDDISLAAEEELEASETATANNMQNLSAADQLDASPHEAPSPSTAWQNLLADIDSKSTKDLMEISTLFITRMRANSAPWLHSSVLSAYGECPTDPALFPWWFASILPISDLEKYKLLSMTSVRERLKLCAKWVESIDSQYRRSSNSSCTML